MPRECLYGLERGARRLADDELMHWKYIKKEKKPNGKWKYYYDEVKNFVKGTNNMYDNINSRTYDQKVAEISNTPEWQEIVKNQDPEYVYTDANGKKVYDIDSYMMNKKHPIVDGLVDFGMGRKITVTKQDKNTVLAGVKDYVNMGKRTVMNIMTAGVGLLTMGLKNQQGSYDKKKREIRSKIETGKKVVNDIFDMYNKATSPTTQAKAKATGNLALDIGKRFLTNLLTGRS